MLYHPDGSVSITVPVTVSIGTASGRVDPPAVNQIIRASSLAGVCVCLCPGVLAIRVIVCVCARAESVFVLSNVGVVALAYQVVCDATTVVDGVPYRWGVVSSGVSGVVAPGATVSVSLSVSSGALPPGEYATVVSIVTNETRPMSVPRNPLTPLSVSEGTVLVVPWSVQVVKALLFPGDVSVSMSPDTPARTLEFSIANFAGSAVVVEVHPAVGVSWVTRGEDVATSTVIASGSIGTFGVVVQYPHDALGEPAPPGLYNTSLNVSCWQQDTGTALPLPPFRISTQAVVGSPSPSRSGVTYLPPDTINVTLRDAGGFIVPYSDTVSSSLGVTSNVTSQLVITGVAAGVWNTSFLVRFVPDDGDTRVVVLVGGRPIPGDVLVHTAAVACDDPLSVVVGGGCVCVAGHFRSVTGSCTPCPAGTYKPDASNDM